MIELYLYPDCETSGLIRNDLAWDDPSQPHLLSLAALLTTTDRRVVGSFYRIIKPEGWSIEPEAEAVHHISERLAHIVGVPSWFALAELQQFADMATKIVGHNLINFDRMVIALALRREKQAGMWWHKRSLDMIDTMELATPVLKMQGQLPGEYKSPTLQEAVRFLGRDYDTFGGEYHFDSGDRPEDGALANWTQSHRADEDVTACEFVHWRLRTDYAAAAPA